MLRSDRSPKLPRRNPEETRWYIPPERHRYVYRPTGELALQITNLAGTGVRGLFRETTRRCLEDILPGFVARLGPVAEALKAKHAEEERLRQEREEQARRWREEEERRWEERLRLERLSKEAVSWREARQLRDFASAALRQLGSATDDDEGRTTRRGELE